MTEAYKQFFNFEMYRRPECYGLIVERKGVGEPVSGHSEIG